MEGLILKAVGGLYTVESPDGVLSCKARGIFRKQGISPCTGDRVTVEDDVITEIMPRKNLLIRPPLANLDQLLFVLSVRDPAPNLQLLDRFLAVCVFKEIQPVLIFTKLDLADAMKYAEIYRPAGFPQFFVDYEKPETVEAVYEALAGKISAFTGNSGVGKSTLLNALSGANGEAEDKLFATLDPLSRVVKLPNGGSFLLVDTVGFISNLPHPLIDAFRSTLEETIQADLLRQQSVRHCGG